MKTVRFTEIFSAIQGEGRYAGTPSVFLRLFGCNLTCVGFGTSPNAPLGTAHPSGLIQLEDLTADHFRSGCDTRYSWAKEFDHLSKEVTLPALMEDLEREASGNAASHLVITGGEPLLQQKGMAEVMTHLMYPGSGTMSVLPEVIQLRHLTFETNGTVPINERLEEVLNMWAYSGMPLPLFSLSPKLEHSGEGESKGMVRKAFLQIHELWEEDLIDYSFKFVVRPRAEDFLEVSGYMADLHRAIYGSSPQQPFAGFDRPMVMPLGSTEEEYRENLPGVADLAMKYGLPVSPRLHVDISGNKPGT